MAFSAATRTAATWAAIFASLVVLLLPAACAAEWWCGARDTDCAAACTDCESESAPLPPGDAASCGDQCLCLSLCKLPVILTVEAELAAEPVLLGLAPPAYLFDLPAGFRFESIEPPHALC